MTSSAITPSTPPAEDAAYWKKRFEQERERVVKLWLAYKTLESSIEDEPEEEEDVAEVVDPDVQRARERADEMG